MRLKNTVAAIMGGGAGTRLFPLTRSRCKPAVPIGGRYRLIDIPISNCINSGLNKIFVLTQFNTSSLHRHIERTYRFDMFSDGFCAIRAAEQTNESESWYQGTADAVRKNLRYLMSGRPEHVIILSGDQLYRMDYGEVMRFHKEKKAEVTICVNPVDRATASSMGLLRVDDDFRIKRFVEKPKDPAVLDEMRVPRASLERCGFTVEGERLHMANMGIYVFNAPVLEKVLGNLSQMDFGKEVMPSNLSEHAMYAYPFAGFWEDIGTIKAFYETNIALTERSPVFNFFDPKAPIYTRPRFLPPTKIEECRIDHSLVSEGGFLEACEIHRSLLSDRCVIRRGSILRDVYMMGADEMEGRADRTRNVEANLPDIGVGAECMIERAIIDKGARIGAGVRITNQNGRPDHDGGFYYIRDGITIIPRHAVVPPGFSI